ncbi:MAG: hypothetical protein L5655_05545 [Thermosediminibacteraceae bacterium]|nr:hypothetical protein [Thermosediminibacteraceae bacterium]
MEKLKDGKIEVIPERQKYLLYDAMIAFHIQRGLSIPMGAAEFYRGLEERFVERDRMYFLPNQVSNTMQNEWNWNWKKSRFL